MSARNKLVEAELFDEYVLATGDYSINLYNKGYYGIPDHKGVTLNGFEALHLLELGRIQISRNNLDLEENLIVIHFSKIVPDFMLRYLVYKDLRNRGYVINVGKGSAFFFRLYSRDSKPKVGGANYYIKLLNEGGSIKLKELDDLIKLARESKKELIFGMVDAVGDVSYLRVNELIPNKISIQRNLSK